MDAHKKLTGTTDETGFIPKNTADYVCTVYGEGELDANFDSGGVTVSQHGIPFTGLSGVLVGTRKTITCKGGHPVKAVLAGASGSADIHVELSEVGIAPTPLISSSSSSSSSSSG